MIILIDNIHKRDQMSEDLDQNSLELYKKYTNNSLFRHDMKALIVDLIWFIKIYF